MAVGTAHSKDSGFDELDGERSGALPVVLAALTGMAIAAVLGWMLNAGHQAELRQGLAAQATSAVGQLRDGYRIAEEKLAAMRAFHIASKEVTRREFALFVMNGLGEDATVPGYGWAPVVGKDQRAAFEQAAVRDGVKEFQFKDWTDGDMRKARAREVYTPIYFYEPAERYRDALGVDLMTLPGRREVLDAARDAGEAVAARLPGGDRGAAGKLMVYQPIYARGEPVATEVERRAAIQGFMSVLVSLDGLLAPVLARLDAGLAVEIFEEGGSESFFSVGAAGLSKGERRRSVTESVTLGGGRWRMVLTPTRDYFAARPDAPTWLGVCLSLAFTTIVCAWIHSMAVRQRRVAAVVDERTSELVIANAALKQEVGVRRKAERLTREKTTELEEVNKELESFSYSISHDLRAPLRAITGFAGFVLRKHEDKLPADAVEHLQQVMKGGDQMNDLIEGLLQFSRLQRVEVKRRNCDVGQMARAIMTELQSTMPQRHVDVVWGKLPAANADPTLLRQVWQNLIGNALKYSAHRESALIEIGSRVVDGETEYYVSDNGAGFDMTRAERLFGVFQRFHSQSQFEGTGIGLANVHKIIQRHGGYIRAEAEVDKGATFRFTLGRDERADLDDETGVISDPRIKK